MAYIWKTFSYPGSTTASTYYFTPSVSIDSQGDIIVSGTYANSYNPSGPDTLNCFGVSYDFFGNAQPNGTISIATSSNISPPELPSPGVHTSAVALPPSLHGGIGFFEHDVSGTLKIQRDIIDTSGMGPPSQTIDDVVAVPSGYVPADVTAQSQTLDNTYEVAYSLWNSSTQAAEIDVQGYNADNTKANSSPTAIATFTGIASASNIPAWQYHAGAGAYVLAIEQVNGSNGHYLHFQSYNANVTTNTSIGGGTGHFDVNVGNTNVNDITDVKWGQYSAAVGNAFAVLDNEIVSGVDEVVFRKLGASPNTVSFTPASGLPQTVSLTAEKPLDIQVVGYGDSNGGATFTEFDSTGAQIAGSTIVLDSSNGQFVNVRSLDDGRAIATFVKTLPDNVTSQYVFDILDFRTAGVTTNDSGATSNVSIAGTKFNDTLMGGSGGDTIYAGSGNDILTGGAGSNTLDGGPGRDVATYNFASTSASIVHNGDGSVSLNGPSVSDTLTNVEIAHFTDRDVALRMRPSRDFNGDGTSDILWRNTNDNSVLVWEMQNGQLNSASFLPSVSSSWTARAQADFNGDGTQDILWRDSSNGHLWVWQMDNGQVAQTIDDGTIASVWANQGIGDFNDDGTGDLLWRNTSTGQPMIWLMQNGQMSSSVNLPTVSSDWQIQPGGTGDFNADGSSDILWRNSTTGVPAIWNINNGNLSSATFLDGVPSDWTIKGTGDFNNDGISDVLWQNSNTQPAIWLMNANGTVASATFLDGVGTDWTIKGVGDFNNDGTSDILWQNSAGQTAVWQMNNGHLSSFVFGQGVPSGWQIQ